MRRLHLGEVDLRADMDIRPGPAELELIWARSFMVAASAAADLHSPVAPVSEDFAIWMPSARPAKRFVGLGSGVGRASIPLKWL